jgi:hypothetical protein
MLKIRVTAMLSCRAGCRGNAMLCYRLAHPLGTHFLPEADYGSSEEMDERSLNTFHLASGHSRAVRKKEGRKEGRKEGAACNCLHKLETPHTEARSNLDG